MSQRDTDLNMLTELIDKHREDLSEIELGAFVDMRWDLTAYQGNATHRAFEQLTDSQRKWLTDVHNRIVPRYQNLASTGAIPPPKKPGEPGYVALMVGALPKRPPPMPKEPLRPQRVSQEHRPFKVTGLDEPGEDNGDG